MNGFARIALCAALAVLLCGAGRAQQDDTPQALLARLSSGDEEARLDAVTRLGGLFESSTGRPVDAAVIGRLTELLQRDPAPVVRALAARALGISGDAGNVPALASALGQEKQLAVRKAILYALARYPNAPAAPVIPLLRDRQAELRCTAAFALAALRDASSATALREYLQSRRKEEDAFGRAAAAQALARLGAREALDALVSVLKKDRSPDPSREAARALGILATEQDAAAIAALQAAAKDDDPYLARAAEEALARIRQRSR